MHGKVRLVLGACFATLAAAPAIAHPASGEGDIVAGLLHPLSGLDHLLAMVAVGIVSVRIDAAAIWRVPAMFVGGMLIGAIIGFTTWRAPGLEIGIAVSVLLLGMAIAVGTFERLKAAVFAVVFAFGFYHGNAHGVELPYAHNGALYALGFLITTIFLHICGIFVGELATGARWRGVVLRVAGVAMTGAGIWFLTGT